MKGQNKARGLQWGCCFQNLLNLEGNFTAVRFFDFKLRDFIYLYFWKAHLLGCIITSLKRKPYHGLASREICATFTPTVGSAVSCKIPRISFFELRLNKASRFCFKTNNCHVLMAKTSSEAFCFKKRSFSNNTPVEFKITLRLRRTNKNNYVIP